MRRYRPPVRTIHATEARYETRLGVTPFLYISLPRPYTSGQWYHEAELQHCHAKDSFPFQTCETRTAPLATTFTSKFGADPSVSFPFLNRRTSERHHQQRTLNSQQDHSE